MSTEILRRGDKKKPHDDQQGDDSFDYYMLAMNWPGSVCESLKPCHGVSSEYNYFTIHGLWPNRDDGSYPSNCEGSRFDESEIEPMISDIRKYWPDFKPDEPNFWRHEWEKHGTCSAFKTQTEYFQNVIDLVKSMPIMESLAKKGIEPNDETEVSVEDMLGAIENGLGYRPSIVCHKRSIKEMRFCFDKDLKGYNCRAHNEGCGNSVILKSVQ